MEGSKESRKIALFQDLHKSSTNSEYDRALIACDTILTEFPDEPTAFESKIICLIMLSKFDEGIELLNKNPKLSGNLWFEKSYCMYRLNRMADAKDILDRVKDQSIKKKELLAQILYRMEFFEECYDTYRDVIKNTSDNYEEERMTNLAAITSSLFATGSLKKGLQVVNGESHDALYNVGCQLTSLGKLKEAEEILEKAEKICIEYLKEDELADDEIEDEVSAIKAQKAYCLQKLGREKEAQEVYNHILKVKPTDLGVVAVVSNNILSLNKDQNIFDSKKRIKTLNSEGIASKLQRIQKKEILFNQCLFYIQTNQAENCKKIIECIFKLFPETPEDGILLSILHTIRKDGYEEAKAVGKTFIEKYPQLSSKITLMLAENDPATCEMTTSIEIKPKKKSKKKKKKKKLPANYDPNVEPDPERWLPRHQRGGHRPKKIRKGRLEVGKGTQGAASESQSAYDMTSRVNKKGEESPRQVASAPTQSTPSWKKPNAKKKKRR